MTDVIEMIGPVTGEIIDQQQIAAQLLAQAKEQGDRAPSSLHRAPEPRRKAADFRECLVDLRGLEPLTP
ncbi:hypothetical protein [Microbacterium sp. SS28]|uniref:hypothetical protein n=1 Tax=Microbacterium sp. SS28 TaxID=2919948 RepID=UPI001FAAB2D1|nr:hypothetical protein [Microbacterium sp. SS28]